MKQLISGIHHVALKCQGTEAFEQTVHFYRDILGMKVARSWGEGRNAGIMLDTGSGLMEIFANAQDVREQGAIRHIALAAENVDACIDAVRAAGYEVTIEPKDIVIASNEAVICGLTPEKACNIKEFAA